MKRLLIASIPLLFSLTAGAQQATLSTGPGMTRTQVQAQIDSVRARNFPPATAEGLSAAEMARYEELAVKHRLAPDAPFYSYAGLITAAEQDELLSLFRRMNRTQQLSQRLQFVRPEPPKPAVTLSEADFNAFKDSTHFTLLVDFRPMANSNLDAYKTSDFAWYSVDPSLGRRAGSAYFTQRVLLQTVRNHEQANERYEKYKNSYQMVYGGTFLRKTRVERPSN
ncbi:hypothetical protein [Flaviaesturariibacter aridisoli]|uniref:Uncharacterized protein n=1 Tax=Flaviaesturariibacter aridisoli TaxID=2545761 RepID=A0A4R4DNT9_9BACT|nr:hypothetical protein [Flaviaesturariibacter aridisoli]TCZ63407.1 hypothetical protein E0486_18600 [Flaviaesturariibacter aridisoli]